MFLRELEIKNLGPIEHAKISPGKLTVLTGHNNTGKTWAMNALYAVFDAFDGLEFPFLQQYVNRLKHYAEAGEMVNDLYFFIYQIIKDNHEEIEEIISANQKSKLSDLFRSNIKILTESSFIKSTLNFDEMHSYNSRDESVVNSVKLNSLGCISIIDAYPSIELPRHVFRDKIPLTQNSKHELARKLGLSIAEFVDRCLIEFPSNSGKTIRIRSKPMGVYNDFSDKATAFDRINSKFLFHLRNCLIGGVKRFFVPAERGGLTLTYPDLGREALNTIRRRRAGVFLPGEDKDIPVELAQYIATTQNYLTILESSRHLVNEETEFSNYLLDKVVCSDFDIQENGEVLFSPRGTDKTLPLHVASSTLKNMYGIWLSLVQRGGRANAHPGGWLFIDEPELNLHPENQRYFARLLVRLVNHGVNVVLSTHSDYIVREINICLMLGDESDAEERAALMQEHGYEESDRLQRSDVKSYDFYRGKDGKVSVNENQIMDYGGISVPSMNEAIIDMNNAFDDFQSLDRKPTNPTPTKRNKKPK
ncbi:MAG: AAA family ATPase [Candidatus Symbiobacter sp.]|nr:AAA family ATPase [Candidatus Symbiobacter sp.]